MATVNCLVIEHIFICVQQKTKKTYTGLEYEGE